jgi:hypothetical protein
MRNSSAAPQAKAMSGPSANPGHGVSAAPERAMNEHEQRTAERSVEHGDQLRRAMGEQKRNQKRIVGVAEIIRKRGEKAKRDEVIERDEARFVAPDEEEIAP